MQWFYHVENSIPLLFSFMLIWLRFFSFFFVANIFRQLQTSPRALNIAAFALTVFVISDNHSFILSKQFVTELSLFEAGLLLIKQILVGFLMGNILNITSSIIISMGQIISSQLGLTFASLIDPRFGYMTSLTQFYILSATIVFFASPLFLELLRLLIETVQYIPLNHTGSFLTNKKWMISLFDSVYSRSVQLALPIIVVAILCQVGMMVVSRFAPQFNMMSIGAPLLLMICLCFVFVSFPNCIIQMDSEWKHSVLSIESFVRGAHV